MSVENWDFKRLPKPEHARAIKAVESLDYELLRQLHDTYKLSPYTYCCDKQSLLVWFRYAIESRQIQTCDDDRQQAEPPSHDT